MNFLFYGGVDFYKNSIGHIFLKNNLKVSSQGFVYSDELSRTSLFYKQLTGLDILFSFYIYKVDKHIYKNSRGKSGKFTFI